MKKILIVVFVLLFMFAVIRITASTYENIKRKNNAQVMSMFQCETEKIMETKMLQNGEVL